MAHGLRPGDRVQVLAYTDGAHRDRAVVLLPTAEVVRVLQDPTGLAGGGEELGVQLRMPSDRAPDVVAAITTGRIFVVKAPGSGVSPSEPTLPSDVQEPPAATSGPVPPAGAPVDRFKTAVRR
jgi:hypothetical protein